MGMKLFDDAGDNDDLEKIEINPEFAKRYQHNKEREDLHRLQEMKKKGLVDSGSESSSESDSDDLDDDDDMKEFLNGLLTIKQKDPILQSKDVKLFDSKKDEDEDDSKKVKKEKKVKPMYIKDVNARNLIEKGANFDDEDDSESDDRKNVKTFVEEQEDLRNEVLAAIEKDEREISDGDNDDFLVEKKRDDDENEGDNDDDEINEKLDDLFGKDEKIDENEKFLKDFLKNKMWIDKGDNNVGVVDEGFELSEDEEDILKQEEYERDFNFRHEENTSDRVSGHSRFVEGSVRIAKNARQNQRESKKKRIELAEIARQEEVKRLKNLKRKEIEDKIRKIEEIAGVNHAGVTWNEDDLEKEFDPVEFDKKMESGFGDEYYNAEDVDPEFGIGGGESDLEKPDFDKEDELLGLPKDWDVVRSGDGFSAKRGDGKSVVEYELDSAGEEVVEEGKRKKKRKSKIAEALRKDLEEELYKYDYEGAIGDLKTRFKYQKVKPDRYKLSAAEILWLDEQELNQYVSLKKLATYREQEWKVPENRKKMLLEGALTGQKEDKKRKFVGEGSSKTVDEQMKEKKMKVDGEGSSKVSDEQSKEEFTLSRSARRRKNRKERQLPPSRLAAYGKTTTSTKKPKN